MYICSLPPAGNTQTHGILKLWSPFVLRGGEGRLESGTPPNANHSGILANTSVDVFLHSKFTIIYTYLFLYTYLCISFYFDQPGRKMMGFFVLVDWSWRKGLEFNYSFSYSFSTKILKYGYIYTCLRLHPND